MSVYLSRKATATDVWVVALGAVLLFLLLPALVFRRDNVVDRVVAINWSFAILAFLASLVLLIAITRQYSRDNNLAPGSPFEKYAFLTIMSGVFGWAAYSDSLVLVDLLSFDQHRELAVVKSTAGRNVNCEFSIELEFENGGTSSICTHHTFSVFRLQVDRSLGKGDRVQVFGRKSWAGFAIDQILEIEGEQSVSPGVH